MEGTIKFYYPGGSSSQALKYQSEQERKTLISRHPGWIYYDIAPRVYVQENEAHFRAVRKKKVIPVKDASGNIYGSISQAAQKLQIDSGSLSKMLSGKRKNLINVRYA